MSSKTFGISFIFIQFSPLAAYSVEKKYMSVANRKIKIISFKNFPNALCILSKQYEPKFKNSISYFLKFSEGFS